MTESTRTACLFMHCEFMEQDKLPKLVHFYRGYRGSSPTAVQA